VRRREFIDGVLDSISDKYDIYHNYWFGGRKFVIYAYCYNHNNKFASTMNESSKLWEAKSYEHLFFINDDNLSLEDYEDLKKFAIDQIEPHFVRADGNKPINHHLYTYITFIVITRNRPQIEVEKAIRNLRWHKSYAFFTRGYCKLRFVCVTPKEFNIIVNDNAPEIKEYLNRVILRKKNYED